MYISFILKPRDLKFGMRVVKTWFYIMKPAVYTYYTYFLIFSVFEASSVLSKSKLDPFLYIWYHTVRTRNGLSPCDLNQESLSFMLIMAMWIWRRF